MYNVKEFQLTGIGLVGASFSEDYVYIRLFVGPGFSGNYQSSSSFQMGWQKVTQITIRRAGFGALSLLIPTVLQVWGFAQKTPVKAAGLQALCAFFEMWHVLKVAPWGITKVAETGIRKSCFCHYRFVRNIICCCVNISYSCVGTAKKWSPQYKLLFSAMNEGLKIHPDSWFCSIWVHSPNINAVKSHEDFQFCTTVNLNSATRSHPILACSWKQSWK